MQAPIPDDFTSDAWLCYAIQWPDSTQWLAILHGLLSTPRMGRFWNAQSGNIKAAQLVGDEIWHRNTPLVSCADSEDCGEPEIVYITRWSCADGDCTEDCENESDMSTCPVPPLKIEDGHLFYWHCCQWVDIGALYGQGPALEEPFADDPSGEPTYSACAKARAIVDLIYEVASIVWDNMATLPIFWVKTVEDAIPTSADLDDDQIINCYMDAVFFNQALGYSKLDMIVEMEKQELACRVKTLLADDAAGITRPQYDAMLGMITAVVGETRDRFFIHCTEAIGPTDMRTITALSAPTYAGEDCDCPEQPGELFQGYAVNAEWRYLFDFRKATLHSAVTLGSTCHHEPGEGIWADSGATQNRTTVAIQALWDQLNNGSIITNVGLVFQTRGDENWDDNYVQVHQEDIAGDLITYADIVAACGEGPAQAGVFTVTKIGAAGIGATSNEFDVQMYAYHSGDQHPDEIGYSNVLVAVLVAGTGPGPLATPPV